MKKVSMFLMGLFALLLASQSGKAQEVTITLLPGYTWISYPGTDTLDFSAALGGFTPVQGDIIQSQWGNAQYRNGRWQGSISKFYPGYGYKYKSTRQVPVSVTFNAQQPTPHVVVTTDSPQLITGNSAMGGGEVTVSDGTYILVRGLCWATHEDPTTNEDNFLEEGSGVGSFSATMTGLNWSTTYYYRAYAVTPSGTVYGEQQSFTTRDGIPTLTTTDITNITAISAASGGNITDNGGLNITARGVCWSTSPNPTVNDSHTTNGTGTGSFTSSITGLEISTTYYVRAYATTNAGTAYGNELTFTTRDGIPTVTTAEVANISYFSAQCGGMVTDNGGLNVTRGVCWSTMHNPTLGDNYTTDGSGLGSFISTLTGLTENSTYYVRAYASTSHITIYGAEVSFTTSNKVIIDSISGIFCDLANCCGRVNVNWPYARGLCWSTSHNPTINDTHILEYSWVGELCSEESYQINLVGEFTAQIVGLCPSTTYYVRAFVTEGTYHYNSPSYINDNNTTYSDEICITTSAEIWTNGTLPESFSVSADRQVHFSQGNLQYRASTDTWRFALNQWSYVGGYVTDQCLYEEEGNVYLENGAKCQNNYISSDHSGWIDLFGWGTSGYDHGASAYQPYSTSQNNNAYWAYGESGASLSDQTGQADWGYNAIINGGNQPNKWRTMTKDEWVYVFNTRNTPSGIRYAKATVNGVSGIILLPDNWSISYFSLNSTNNSGASFSSNIINAFQWCVLEQYGAVFLPVTGLRRIYWSDGEQEYESDKFFYWSSSNKSETNAWHLMFKSTGVYPQDNSGRHNGMAVRLVQDVE